MTSLHPGSQPLNQAQNIYPRKNHQASQSFYQGPVFGTPPPRCGTSFRDTGFKEEFSHNEGSDASFHDISSLDLAYSYDQPFQTNMRRNSWTTSPISQDDDISNGKEVSVPKRKRRAIALDESQRLEKRRIGNMVAARKLRDRRKDELETLRRMYSEEVDKSVALQAQLCEALSAKYQLSIELGIISR